MAGEISLTESQKLEQTISPRLLERLDILFSSLDQIENIISNQADVNPALEIKTKTPNRVSTISGGDEIIDQSESKEDLKDHLNKALGLSDSSQLVKEVAEQIISALDARGFLVIDADEFRSVEPLSKLPHDEQTGVINEATRVVSLLDPVGCAAHNSFESLQIQAVESGLENKFPFIAQLISPVSFELFSKGKLDVLAKRVGTTPGMVKLAFDKIKLLNPFPGYQYGTDFPPAIRSLIKFEVDSLGNISVHYNDDEIPDVSISPEAQEILSSSSSKDEKSLWNKYIKEGQNLIALLDERRAFVYKFGQYLAAKQERAIKEGRAYLKPLTFTEAASQLGVSVSTVSRFASSHSAITPMGPVLISKLFSSPTSAQSKSQSSQERAGEVAKSQAAVIEMIRDITSKSERALSDSEIVKLLGEKGVFISRRTVSKYRMKANIANSYQRD